MAASVAEARGGWAGQISTVFTSGTVPDSACVNNRLALEPRLWQSLRQRARPQPRGSDGQTALLRRHECLSRRNGEMTDEEIDIYIEEVEKTILDWLETLPKKERYSVKTLQQAKVIRLVTADAAVSLSGGKKKYQQLAAKYRDWDKVD